MKREDFDDSLRWADEIIECDRAAIDEDEDNWLADGQDLNVSIIN